MRIALKINQGVSKVVLSNPYCGSLYMYALNAIKKNNNNLFTYIARVTDADAHTRISVK